MSVSFFTSGGPDEVYIPVAAESFYEEYWLPKASVENLWYLSMLSTGVPVDATNVDDIISELTTLAAKIPNYPDVADDIKAFWLERLQTLLTALERERSRPNLDGYLG